MQKALRRNLLARNQALKSSRRKAGKSLREERRAIRQETVLWNRAKRSDIKAERENRREDWMLGPLAPNRLAGQDGGGYGMLNFQSVRPPVVFTAERERYFNFAVNDRVVVVKGREKGKIGKIKEVDQERQTVALFDVNIVSSSRDIIFLSALRLVHDAKSMLEIGRRQSPWFHARAKQLEGPLSAFPYADFDPGRATGGAAAGQCYWQNQRYSSGPFTRRGASC